MKFTVLLMNCECLIKLLKKVKDETENSVLPKVILGEEYTDTINDIFALFFPLD